MYTVINEKTLCTVYEPLETVVTLGFIIILACNILVFGGIAEDVIG